MTYDKTLLEAQVFQIPAIISVIASSLVILITVLFKDMRVNVFIHIVCFISVCDMLGNSTYLSTERPEDGTVWCSINGFMNLYFYPVSWMWTTILMHFLYDLAISGKLNYSMGFVHLVAWGGPLMLTLLVLATNTYGKDPDSRGTCSYGGDHEVGFIYHMITYYGLFIACAIYMCWMFAVVRRIWRQQEQLNPASPTLTLALYSLKLYPQAMILLWGPRVIGVLMQFCFPASDSDGFFYFFLVAGVLKILHGAVTSFIFFYKSSSARQHVKELGLLLICRKPSLANSPRQVSRASEYYIETFPSVDGGTENPLQRFSYQSDCSACRTGEGVSARGVVSVNKYPAVVLAPAAQRDNSKSAEAAEMELPDLS